jgi:hypothetical protein
MCEAAAGRGFRERVRHASEKNAAGPFPDHVPQLRCDALLTG